MTRFAEPSFSVAAPLTRAYAENHRQTFGSTDAAGRCTECSGHGQTTADFALGVIDCSACEGTGKRVWQRLL